MRKMSGEGTVLSSRTFPYILAGLFIVLIGALITIYVFRAFTWIGFLLAIIVLMLNAAAFGMYLYQKTSRYKEKQDARRRYERSQFYLQTSIPYQALLKTDRHRLGYETFQAVSEEGYWFFHVLIPDERQANGFAFADAVFLHQSGIYVLKFEPIDGKVYGSETSDFWTISQNGPLRTREVPNPIKQNAKRHEALLNFREDHIEPVVILEESADLRQPINRVYTPSDFQEALASASAVLDASTLDDIRTTLERNLLHNAAS